jgi:uncharacterized oxidoreductase
MEEAIKKQGFKKGAVIHGRKSWEAAHDKFASLDLMLTHMLYGGECSKEEVARMEQAVLAKQADYLIGVGGGKVLDLVKAIAHTVGKPYILVPTLASNCAPWTPLSVFYDEDGNFINYEIFSHNAFMVAVDPEIIIHSPKDYLRAGIGDTLAKWYEAEVLIRDVEPKPLAIEVSIQAAQLCRDVLLEEGMAAIKALEEKSVTSSFTRVIETIIMAGGMVGGYGDRYGRIAGAHSIHNGLTTIPATHSCLHGDKVAYGILVQLVLDKNFEEVTTLLPFYKRLNLPVSLADLNVSGDLAKAFNKTALAATKEGESIHFMKNSSAEAVMTAMSQLEDFIQSYFNLAK